MVRHLMLLACLAACSLAATAQSSSQASSSTGPVAYVYVGKALHLAAYAVASNGNLTQLPGSPFPNIYLQHESVNKNYLFGGDDDGKHIDTYSIASNGSVKEVASIDATKYAPDGSTCETAGPSQLDYTGSTLYNFSYYNCNGGDSYIQSFRIESGGGLQYLGRVTGAQTKTLTLSQLRFAGTNQFAYQAGCNNQTSSNQMFAPEPVIIGYKRESNGNLVLANTHFNLPAPRNSDDTYCPYAVLAGDPSDHFALALQAVNKTSALADGPIVLASYTVDSAGNLTTKNTFLQMPAMNFLNVHTMSIDPTGKFLAVGADSVGCGDCGGSGLQIFHFNGSAPVTLFTEVVNGGNMFQFGWDKDHHLFALTDQNLHVYTVTADSVKEAPGSPYSIGAFSLIVKSTH